MLIRKSWRSLLSCSAVFLLLILFVASIAWGAVSIPLAKVMSALQNPDLANSATAKIIWQFRLPQAITAVLAGASLSVSGLQMQTLFQNPLAGPFVLGISAGSSLGVALLVLTGWEVWGSFPIVVASGAGAFAVLVLLLLAVRWVKSGNTLLVLGLLLGYIANGLVSILFQFTNSDRLRNFINWTLGSFSNVTWAQIPIMAVVISLGLLLSLAITQPLNALLLGESQARTLGVSLTWLRFWLLVSTALLTGSVTAFCGPIAFIGVVVPHLCRLLWRTSEHRQLWLTTLLVGSSLALVADLGTRVLGNGIILPLNGITALIGTPIMIWLILVRNSAGDAQKWYL